MDQPKPNQAALPKLIIRGRGTFCSSNKQTPAEAAALQQAKQAAESLVNESADE